MENSEKMQETFHQFASQNSQTSRSTQSPSEALPPNESTEHNLNKIQMLFPMRFTVRTFLMDFKLALKQTGYKCIDLCQKQVLMVRITLLDKFRKLFLCKQPPKFVVTVTTHEFLNMRKLQIEPFTSKSNFSEVYYPNSLQKDMDHFRKLLQKLPCLNEVPLNENEDDQQQDYKQDFYSLDATSFYMYSKMLIDRNYSIGSKMAAVSQKFKQHQKIESLQKSELQWLSGALNEISDDLLQGFNCSRSQLLQILSYCRKSVEQYFHIIHKQINVNRGRCLQFDSEGYGYEIKEIVKITPLTLKQFLKLERSETTMDIVRSMFMAGLIYKVQCHLYSLEEQVKYRVNELIRTCFSGTINDKIKILKSSGYEQKDYEKYINKFNFDHEVTL